MRHCGTGKQGVRERARIGCFEQRVPCTAPHHEAEIPDELFIMLLADPIEVHDLAVKIVKHLDFRWLFVKEHLRASGKGLDVRRMLGENGDEGFCNGALAADVGKRSDHVW